MKKLVQLSTEAKRGTIEQESILQNVNIQNDILTTPKNLISKFVLDADKIKYNEIVNSLNSSLSLDKLNLDSLRTQTFQILDELDKNNINYDVRLKDRNNIFKGDGNLFFEQFDLKLSGDLTDSEFNDVYLNLKRKLEDSPNSFISFISKSDSTRTIQYTATTRVIKSITDNEPLIYSYQARGRTEPYMSIEKNTADKKKVNYSWETAILNLFDAVKDIDSNLIVQIGKSSQIQLKSHFFESNELSEEDLKEELEIKETLENSKNVKTTNNNNERGSMSPNASKDYIENKEINEDIVDLDKKLKKRIDELTSNRDSLKDSIELLKQSKSADVNEMNNIGGKIFNINQEIDKLTKQLKEDVVKEEIDVDSTESINEEESQKLEELIIEEKNLSKKIEERVIPKVDSIVSLETNESFEKELAEIYNKEIEAHKIAHQRKLEQAPQLADEMLKDFKTMFEQGGSVISNVEKINQKYRDNIYAFEMFNTKLKLELKSGIIKDKIIVSLNDNIKKIISDFNNVKEKYEKTIGDITEINKKLSEEKNLIELKYADLDLDFQKYSELSVAEIHEKSKKINELESMLVDYEAMKKEEEQKDALLLEFEDVTNALKNENVILKNENTVLQGKLSNQDTLVSLNKSQENLIQQLQADNKKLRDDFNIASASIKELKEQMAKINEMNLKLQQQINSYQEKIQITSEMKEALKEQHKSVKVLQSKEKILNANTQGVNYLKSLVAENLEKDILDLYNSLDAPSHSEEYHRLLLIKKGNINFEAFKNKYSQDSVMIDVVGKMLDDLTQIGLVYQDKATNKHIIKENGKIALYNNPKASLEELKETFDNLQLAGRKTADSENKTADDNSSKTQSSYKKLR